MQFKYYNPHEDLCPVFPSSYINTLGFLGEVEIVETPTFPARIPTSTLFLASFLLLPYVIILVTGLYELWKTGRYRSYPPDVLVDLVARILALVPPWTRVYRVQR